SSRADCRDFSASRTRRYLTAVIAVRTLIAWGWGSSIFLLQSSPSFWATAGSFRSRSRSFSRFFGSLSSAKYFSSTALGAAPRAPCAAPRTQHPPPPPPPGPRVVAGAFPPPPVPPRPQPPPDPPPPPGRGGKTRRAGGGPGGGRLFCPPPAPAGGGRPPPP